MRPSVTLRRATAPLFNAATGSTSTSASSALAAAAAKPSRSSTPFLPDGQASAATLRSLVSLHHAASTFMHSPTEAPRAFDEAVKNAEATSPAWRTFEQAARARAAERAHGGLSQLARVGAQGRGARGAPRMPAEQAHDIWRGGSKGWSAGGGAGARAAAHGSTERELRVREALFGTWERADKAVPSLEGVIEVLEASGSTVQQSADEWRMRDAEAAGKGETEDGM
ncbi:hypothetical protein Q5752_001841 [Cryptotrichosporon argae]